MARDERPRGNRPRNPPIKAVQAPYAFVPLSPHVVEATGDAATSGLQDVPATEGALSGVLEILVDTDTPVFIGGVQEDGREAAPYKTPDGKHAIPGSTLRGMLRNVVEIASFGALGPRVNDHRYGVRDLQNRVLYGSHMATLAEVNPRKRGQKVPYPFSCAGMLRPATPADLSAGQELEDYPAAIDVRSFAKVHYEELVRYAASRGLRGYEPGRRQSAPEKYRAWGRIGLDVGFEVEEWVGHGQTVARQTRQGAYGVASLSNEGTRTGRLVFTGQPSAWSPNASKGRGAGNAKQNDFVFYGSHGTLLVDRKTLDDFNFIHSNRGQQNRLTDSPNDELSYLLSEFGGAPNLHQWLAEAGPDQSLPVFFITDADGGRERVDAGVKVRAMGLAMMFRLAYRLSVGEAVARYQKSWSGVEDLADRIFGFVPLEEKGERKSNRLTRKGRVWVGDARLVDTVLEERPVTAILSAPKASFYPNYVEQGAEPGSMPSRHFKTWHDEDARPRGWKRVPPRAQVASPYIPSKVKDLGRVGTTFRPWRANKGLVFKLRFHNLTQEELGAVVWALDFGGRPELRHTVGLAKQLGYGSVRLRTVGGSVRSTKDWDSPIEGAGLRSAIAQAREAYAAFMEDALDGLEPGGWAASRAVFELLETARVQAEGQRHLRIDDPVHGNEFIAAKKQNLALPPVGNEVAWRREVFAREQTVAAAQDERARAAAVDAVEALRDAEVPARTRIDRWAEPLGARQATEQLRQWFGFKGRYDDEPDAMLALFEPETSDLTPGVVAFLMDHQGLGRQSRLADDRRALLQQHLHTLQGAPSTSEAQPVGHQQPYVADLPDWSRLGEKKKGKTRARWATGVAEGGPWDLASLKRILDHLRAQGAPDGQLREVVRHQARRLGVTEAALGEQVGVRPN